VAHAASPDLEVNAMPTTQRQQWNRIGSAPATSLGVALKCATCLALLGLLAVIGGTYEADRPAQAGPSGAAVAAATTPASGAAAHRKQVFDERRARFLGNAPDRDGAAPAPIAHADTPMP
jgi:hypothetical protein